VEGPITGLSTNGKGAIITVMQKIQVHVPAGTLISSPSRSSLSIAELLDSTSFEGLEALSGFLGGNVIVNGTVDVESGVVQACDVFVNPADAVLQGVITELTDTDRGLVRINGLPAVPTSDARVPACPACNDLGFAIDLAAIPLGSEVTVRGYWGPADGLFHYFHLEVAGAPACAAGLQASIRRATARLDRGEIEVSGGISGAIGSAPVIIDVMGGEGKAHWSIGKATVVMDPVHRGAGTYKFRGIAIKPFPLEGIRIMVRQGMTVGTSPGAPGLVPLEFP